MHFSLTHLNANWEEKAPFTSLEMTIIYSLFALAGSHSLLILTDYNLRCALCLEAFVCILTQGLVSIPMFSLL